MSIKCPYCGSEEIEIINDEVVCTVCGTVLEENHIAETAFYNSVPYRESTHAKPVHLVLREKTLSDTGRELRVRRKERKLLRVARKQIIYAARRLGAEAHTDTLIKLAEMLVTREVRENSDITARIVKSYTAALLYHYMKHTGKPVPHMEIIELTGAPRKNFMKHAKKVEEFLREKALAPEKKDERKALVSAMSRKLTALGVNTSEIKRKTLLFIEATGNTAVWSGVTPRTVVAAVMYLAIREQKKVSVKKVAELLGVASNNLGKKIREIEKTYRIATTKMKMRAPATAVPSSRR